MEGNTMQVKPIGERVLIKPLTEGERTKGGIYIPESAKEKKKEGEVIAVGTNKEGKDLPLKKGDRILYGGYSADEVRINDEEYVFVEFKDVLAKFE